MNKSTVNNIIIIGGGTAGWMTASTLIKCFPYKNISLIESPNISTVGVGESTLGQIRGWQALLDIKDKDFLVECDATYKLSIKFTDFYQKGESFHYPFGRPAIEPDDHLNDWWGKKFLYPETPYSDYATCNYSQMALVNENKCFFNEPSVIPFDFYRNTAFQFDATKFGLWLRDNVCIPAGLKHIKEEIKTIEQDKNGIKTLNKKYKADLFIDCTGFKSLLLEQTLKEPFIDLADTLPNNSTWATKIPYTDKRKQLVGYTNCTAVENGWIWNIPLWSRMGCGYVYSDKFISDDDALKEFQKHIGTTELDFQKIKFRTGIHQRLWVKNVCAIGLSAGFIEPLESNGLYSIHEFIHQLVRTLQRGPVSQWDKDTFTVMCKGTYYGFMEFLAMHYSLSHRQDTPYWRDNFNRQWDEDVLNLVPVKPYEGFQRAIYDRGFNYSFPNDGGGLHCIAAGMHWGPIDVPSLIKDMDGGVGTHKKIWQKITDRLDKRKHDWKRAIKDAPIMYDFLKENYYGPSKK
jgi:tryptophan halogenase